MYIVDTAGVMTPAYLAILSKGYSVRDEGGLMIAERADDTFVAEGPIQILGLIAMAEIRGKDWGATDAEIEDYVARFC